jgi:hypothetical protein
MHEKTTALFRMPPEAYAGNDEPIVSTLLLVVVDTPDGW